MAWTNPKTWSAEPITDEKLNAQIRDNMNALKAPPMDRNTPSSNATFNTSDWTVLDTGTITTTGGDILVIGTIPITVSSGIAYCDITLDGVSAGGSDGIQASESSRGFAFNWFFQNVEAGEHTLTVRFKSSGSCSYTANTGVIAYREIS